MIYIIIYNTMSYKHIIPVSFNGCLTVEVERTHELVRRESVKVKPFVSCSASNYSVTLQVHDPICSSMVHLAIIEELVFFENTISLFP